MHAGRTSLNTEGQDRTGHTTSKQKRLKGMRIAQRRRDQKLLQMVLVEQQDEGRDEGGDQVCVVDLHSTR